jgi:hypothetical protein
MDHQAIPALAVLVVIPSALRTGSVSRTESV